MPEKQQSKTTKSKNLLSEDMKGAKKLPQRKPPGAIKRTKNTPKRGNTKPDPKKPVKQKSPVFPAKTVTIEGTKFSVKFLLEVTAKKVTIQKPKQEIRGPDKVIDENGQIFNYSTATVTYYEDHALPEERVVPVEAEDAELIMKLLGVVKP